MGTLEDLDVTFPYIFSDVNKKQGAEAKIFECLYLGREAILKERSVLTLSRNGLFSFSKSYRHELLDSQLNKTRLRNEVKGIVKARQVGRLEI